MPASGHIKLVLSRFRDRIEENGGDQWINRLNKNSDQSIRTLVRT
jgi:hypothetical protein